MSLPPITPQAFEEILARLNGEDLEDYRERQSLRLKLNKEAARFFDLPTADWPPLVFNWDISRESQRFALDGIKTDKFQKQYPGGFILGRTQLAAFDARLCRFSRRDGPEELWNLGSKSSLAYMVAYLANGAPITPPLIAPLESQELVIRGGHHRYAAAKAVGIEELPFYAEPQSRIGIENILPVRWDEA